MAKINEIQIKNLKSFVGHECDYYQGNVYYKNKKLGFWSQDSMGGADNFYFNTKILEEEIDKFKNSSYIDRIFKNNSLNTDENTAILLDKLVFLSQCEKEYKKQTKKGHKTMILAVGDTGSCLWSSAIDINKLNPDKKDKIIINAKKDLAEHYYKQFEISAIDFYIYTSLEDFNISL